MKKLLSLPPNLVDCFHDVTGYSREEWFCTNDPVGHKLGSGGGTAWLLQQAYEEEERGGCFSSWLSSEKRILLHAGGQSRRLPAYAPSGKILTPIPVFRWERGQRLSQDLLSLQVPLYERIMEKAPESLHTMVVSGDVFIRATQPLQPIPDVDVVCYGLWLDAQIAKNHGVFVSTQENPSVLKCMLQKPSVETLNNLLHDHFYLTDIGVWLLSDRAVELLMKKTEIVNPEIVIRQSVNRKSYDLYTDFGGCLGTDPTLHDEELAQLSVAILPLPGGEFYHFGTSRQIISSTLAIQNLVNDQREILHHGRKPHPSIFQQNAVKGVKFTAENQNIWLENSCVGEGWTLTRDHIITGVPDNQWAISLQPGQCVDIVPIGDSEWVVRPYEMDDTFSGDQQFESLFPVVDNIDDMGDVLRWMLGEKDNKRGQEVWEKSRRLSAEEISNQANLRRLTAQRRDFRMRNWPVLAENYSHSVFYQIDLEDAAREFSEGNIPLPPPLPESEPLLIRMHDAMFRGEEDRAFALLRQALVPTSTPSLQGRAGVGSDQIIWARSPVRIDLAGGWTDTPPYSLMEGGCVVNIAICLNGQQPLQAYVKPCSEPHIVLRSIDLGATEVVESFEQLADYNRVGSPFSIPKAALNLAGFTPHHDGETLTEHLRAFGSGVELTMLSAIPAGSGLGTSSILAATVLAALSDFCCLAWDKAEIGSRTLQLEQMLTTGGGWQDQYGGILPGVKLLETQRGFVQQPQVRWLPTGVFTQPDLRPCHLLYYTGITRTAKQILQHIVKRMFLNQHDELALLRQMKEHTLQMYDALQRQDFQLYGQLVRRTWQQNQTLDSGTNPPEVARLTDLVDDLCLGYKLPGAGGGGYLYMIAKDPDAAARIRQILSQNPLNARARFVDMKLSETGLEVSRS
ncbi:MAG: bifunctional fucokinase/L-fucose-1-P-guanylyltransferase [Prevotella sp.]|nr:bifunctional fucokinase/L-fucose-1-P-guanylyltransferase [Prevotella sp.]